jgi:DNA-binding transcriptional LysR family regulator
VHHSKFCMELYQLAYFREIARQRHFTRSAARLNVSQPALSHQMHNLEAEFGAPLLIRGRNQVQLTPAGEVLLPYIEELFAQKEVAKQTVANVARLRGGRLTIATISVANVFWMSDVISRFRQRFPRVDLVLLENNSERVTEMVESGRAELGFLQLPFKSSKRFDARELVTEPFVLLVSSTHTATRQKSVHLAQFARESFVFSTGRAGDTAYAACRAAGFEPRVVCESSEDEAIRLLVLAGLGVAIVAKQAARELPKGVVAIALRTPRIERTLGMISRHGYECSAAAKEFASLLCAGVRN